jgi:hypothetical protein
MVFRAQRETPPVCRLRIDPGGLLDQLDNRYPRAAFSHKGLSPHHLLAQVCLGLSLS